MVKCSNTCLLNSILNFPIDRFLYQLPTWSWNNSGFETINQGNFKTSTGWLLSVTVVWKLTLCMYEPYSGLNYGVCLYCRMCHTRSSAGSNNWNIILFIAYIIFVAIYLYVIIQLGCIIIQIKCYTAPHSIPFPFVISAKLENQHF